MGSDHLHMIVDKKNCLFGATIFTPSSGNATFSAANGIGKSFRYMAIIAGTDAQHISLDTDPGNNAKDDLERLKIDASSAEYLEITLRSGASWEDGEMLCPNSSSHHPSCILGIDDGSISN